MAEKEAKPKSKARKIIGWVITGIFGALFCFVLVFQIVSKQSASTNYGVPNFNGFQTLVVLTDSMEPEYKVGSACFVVKTDVSTLKKGDDITFYYQEWKVYMDNPIVTHRIMFDPIIDETKEIGKGRYTFTVSGINEDSEQAYQVSGGKTRKCTDQTQTVVDSTILGKVVGNSRFVGALYSFITSIWGLIIIILIPCIYLIISYGVDVIKTLKQQEEVEAATSKATTDERLKNLSDKDKERLKQQLLEKMMEDKKNENK